MVPACQRGLAASPLLRMYSCAALPALEHAVIIMGPPGVGKDTLGQQLAVQCDLPRIDCGALFRDHMAKETPIGRRARFYVEQGALVPDRLLFEMFSTHCKDCDTTRGVIISGFPRSVVQANTLWHAFQRGTPFVVLKLDAERQLLVERLAGRVVCEDCGTSYNHLLKPPGNKNWCDQCQGHLFKRIDDTFPLINHRLKVYEKEIAPVEAYFKMRGRVHTLDASASSTEVLRQALMVCK